MMDLVDDRRAPSLDTAVSLGVDKTLVFVKAVPFLVFDILQQNLRTTRDILGVISFIRLMQVVGETTRLYLLTLFLTVDVGQHLDAPHGVTFEHT